MLGLFFVEIFFRIFWQPEPATNQTGLEALVVFDSKLETRYQKNAAAVVQSPHGEFEIKYLTNDIGLRDGKDFSKKKKISRILAVGNSFVEGWGVSEANRFTDVAEEYFNEGAKIKIDIVNAGISGYGVLQSYLFLKEIYSVIEPNHVMFFYMSTMSLADARYERIADFDDDGFVTGLDVDYLLSGANSSKLANEDKIPEFFSELAEFSHTAKYLMRRYQNRLLIADLKRGDLASDLFATLRNGAEAEYREKTYDHILKMRDFVRSKGVRFTLVYLPTPLQVSTSEWNKGKLPYQFTESNFEGNERIVRAFCRDNTLSCLFPTSELQNLANIGHKKLFFEYDFHLNVEGNKALGVWLGNHLTEILE